MQNLQLKQYNDLKKEVEDLENKIIKIRKKLENNNEIVSDLVQASNTEYPYQQMNLTMTGIPANEKLHELLSILQERKLEALKKQIEIEKFINSIPDARTRLVFEKKYIDCWSWQQIAFFIQKSDESYPRKEIHDKYLRNYIKSENSEIKVIP